MPTLDVRHAFLQRVGAHVGLQVDVVGAELLHMFDDRLEFVDSAGVALRLPVHAVRAQEARHVPNELAIRKAHATAVKTRRPDHLELLVK